MMLNVIMSLFTPSSHS